MRVLFTCVRFVWLDYSFASFYHRQYRLIITSFHSPMWHTLVLLLISSATTSACDTDALYQIALRDVQHRHVDVVQDASGQRKLVARKALRRGQVALSVPTSACINLGLAPAAVRPHKLQQSRLPYP